MRLTYKYEKSSGYGSARLKNLPNDPLVDKLPYLDDAWQEQRNKLGQLEDIEEELGIDLVTLFKALKNGIWASMYGEKVEKGTTLTFINKNVLVIIFEPFIPEEDFKPHFIYRWGMPNDYSIYYLKDYGKTWALTKEELL